MKTETLLIDAHDFSCANCRHNRTGECDCWCENGEQYSPDLMKLLTVNAVPRGAHEQVRWERDTALKQLADYGISLGEKADVVKVVRCKDCKRSDSYKCGRFCEDIEQYVDDDFFCADGERRTDV